MPLSQTGGETGAMKQMSGLQKKFLFYILPFIAVLFTVAQPAAVQLSFFTASSLGMLQARLLRSNSVREWFGLSPIVVNAAPSGSRTIDTTARVNRPGQFKYEAPTVGSSIAGAGKINAKSMDPLTRIKKSISETVKEAQEFRDGILKRTGMYQKNTGDRKQTKEFQKRAADYETRRTIEQQQEAEFKRQRRRR